MTHRAARFHSPGEKSGLGWLQAAIAQLEDGPTRECLLTLFSGVLEFNNLFASYKGEGTGAVRHMFSHHVLKPERAPIEANVWGTPKSSGSFSSLFRSRLLRAVEYREAPTEVGDGGARDARLCSPPFTGEVQEWPDAVPPFAPRGIYLSCGDSASSGLPARSVDLVVTDPPFFDNVHYSELADFFFAWQQLVPGCPAPSDASTRSISEVQDPDAGQFAEKLRRVFAECRRVLKDDGLLVFTYHHSRDEGWTGLARAIIGAGFVVVNSQPVKSEMSVATPKSQAKDPIQLDIIIVCRNEGTPALPLVPTVPDAVGAARDKLGRLSAAGLELSGNDRKVVLFGQLLTTVRTAADAVEIGALVEAHLAQLDCPKGDGPARTEVRPKRPEQMHLF